MSEVTKPCDTKGIVLNIGDIYEIINDEYQFMDYSGDRTNHYAHGVLQEILGDVWSGNKVSISAKLTLLHNRCNVEVPISWLRAVPKVKKEEGKL